MRRLVPLAIFATSSCLFPALTGLTDDVDGAALDGQPADTANDVESDTVTDAQAVDDAQASDAPGDSAGNDADAGFCVANAGHTFCEDFDEPNFQTRWDAISLSTGATAATDNTTSVSAPSALLTSFTFPANGGGHAYAMKHFNNASKLKVQAQLVVSTAAMAVLDPLQLTFNPAPTGYSAYEVHLDVITHHLGYVATPSDGGAQLHFDTTFANPLSAWHNVEVDLDMTTAAISVFVDGTPAVQWTIAPVSPTGFDLRLGLAQGSNATTSAAPVAVHVDNVLVDVQ